MYTSQRVEYSGGSFFGNEKDEPTRTLLAFYISSVCGPYEDLVCFVPVTTLHWDDLLSHFRQVGTALTQIGFQILPILTDGHRTNCRFFKELGGGILRIPVQSPFAENLPLFPIFDSVHLMKNFYNNFERKRYVASSQLLPQISSPIQTVLINHKSLPFLDVILLKPIKMLNLIFLPLFQLENLKWSQNVQTLKPKLLVELEKPYFGDRRLF